MPNSKMVSYRNGNFIVVKSDEIVENVGQLDMNGQLSVNGVMVKATTDLVVNFNADLLDGAHKATVVRTDGSEDDASIPTELAVVTYVSAEVAAEKTARENADAAIQGELDATQAGAGLTEAGAYTAHGSATYISGASSLHNADLLLDQAIQNIATAQTSGIQWKASVADLAALEAAVAADASKQAGDAYFVRSENDIYVYQPGLANPDHTDGNNETFAIMADLSQITGYIDAIEGAVGLEADSSYVAIGAGSNYNASNKNSLKEDFASVVGDLDGHIDAIEGAVELNADGSFIPHTGSNYLNAATTMREADVALDDQAKVEETKRLAIHSGVGFQLGTDNTLPVALGSLAVGGTVFARLEALSDALKTEQTDRATGDTNEATARANADAAIQAELDASQTGAGLNADGTYTANGAAQHISGATSLKDADTKLDSAIKAETDRAELAEQNIQSELDASQTGAGLEANGAYLANADTNYMSTATSLKSADELLDAKLFEIEGELDAEVIARGDADAAIQSELDAHETSTGMNADGTFSAYSGTNHIDAAATMKAADVLLDSAIKAESDRAVAAEGILQDNIDAEATTRENADTAIQSELDATQAGAGLASDGSYIVLGGSNYLTAASSLQDADSKLDAEIKAVNDKITNLGSAFQYIGSLNAAPGSTLATTDAQFQVDGAAATNGGDYYKVEFQGTISHGGQSVEVNVGDSIVFNNAGGMDKIDNSDPGVAAGSNIVVAYDSPTEVYTVGIDPVFEGKVSDLETQADAIQAELDTTQTGAGLATDGTYVAVEARNYIGAASSLDDADAKLDAALKQEEIDRQSADTQLANDIQAERTRAEGVESALQSELDATQAAAGLDAGGNFVAHSGSNYVDSAVDMKDVDAKLDAQIKVNEDAIAALDVEVVTVSGAPESFNIHNGVLDVQSASGNLTVGHAKDGDNVKVSVGMQPEVSFEKVTSNFAQIAMMVDAGNPGNSVSFGDMLRVSANGQVLQATNDVTPVGPDFVGHHEVIGMAIENAGSGAMVSMAIAGQIVPFDMSNLLGLGSKAAGAIVYLDVNGQMTVDAPDTFAGSTYAVVKLGVICDATTGTTPEGMPAGSFFFQPQTIAID